MMEAKKIEETRTLVRQASSLLREHLQQSPHTPLSPGERQSLRALLQLLLPSLSIVRSYEQQHHLRRVYTIVESAVEKTLTCPALSEGDAPTEANFTSEDDQREWHASDGAVLGNEDTTQLAHVAAPAVATVTPLWKDMYGCHDAVLALRQATTLPLLYPTLFTGPRQPWRRLLLYGSPGTGKTQLAAATAAEYGAVFLSVSAADLLSKWVGESEKQVRQAFTQAAAARPRCVLFFDEVDALCSVRGGQNESELARRLKTEFLLHLQNVAPTVVVLAATNLPWELDTAVLRRFERLVHVGLPSPDEKLQFLRDELRGVAHTLTDVQLRTIVAHTEGFSLVDLRRLLSYAVMAPVTEWLAKNSPFDADTADSHATGHLQRVLPFLNDGEVVVKPPCTSPPSSPPPCHQGWSCLGAADDEEAAVLGDTRSGSIEEDAMRSHCAPTTTSIASSMSTRSGSVIDTTSLPHHANVPAVEAKHFEDALRSVSATASASDITRYLNWSSHAL